jgi:hypothetical protein
MDYTTGRSTVADPSKVSTRDGFADFMETVLSDFRLGGGSAEWENATLDRSLEALAAVAGARVMDTGGQETASWGLLATMITAATGYE